MGMTNGKLLNKYGKRGYFSNNTIIRDGNFNDDTTCVHTKWTPDASEETTETDFQGICPGWHFVFSESFRGMSAAGVVDEWIVLDAIGTWHFATLQPPPPFGDACSRQMGWSARRGSSMNVLMLQINSNIAPHLPLLAFDTIGYTKLKRKSIIVYHGMRILTDIFIWWRSSEEELMFVFNIFMMAVLK